MAGQDLRGLRTVVRVLDDLVPIPGTRFRFGLDPLIGLIPGAGDVAAALLSGYALLVAARLGAPPAVLVRMVGNIAIDTVVGAIPVVGDAFDFGWKSNRRNLALLERYERSPAAVARGSRAILVLALLALLALTVGVGFAAFYLLRWLARTMP
jgi:hypothetical protein